MSLASVGPGCAVTADGRLLVGGCDAVALARTYGTPLYAVDEARLRANCRRYRQAFAAAYPGRSQVIYAGKAFLVTGMARLVAEEGLGLDVVSAGELAVAQRAGFPPERIWLHGNYKPERELELALEAGVGRIVVDSLQELEVLDRVARGLGRKARIYLRLTPGVEADTHPSIATGHERSKFGLGIPGGEALAAARLAARLDGLELVGLHCHIGSQLLQLDPFVQAAHRMVEALAAVRDETGLVLGELDLGGGLGIRYTPADEPPPVEAYARALAEAVVEATARHGLPLPVLLVEPGRSIAGEAGVTLYTVGVTKRLADGTTYVAVDGGMGDNPRPALYQAAYHAVVAGRALVEPGPEVALVGRYCESGDVIIPRAALAGSGPEGYPAPGDVVAVFSTGAYNYSMFLSYNGIPRPAVVFCRGGLARLVVRRQTVDDLLAGDVDAERGVAAEVGGAATAPQSGPRAAGRVSMDNDSVTP